MNREQLIDKLYSKAIIYFNNSIDFEYEDEYRRIGRAYVFLAERVSRNQMDVSSLKEKLEKLDRYARNFKWK